MEFSRLGVRRLEGGLGGATVFLLMLVITSLPVMLPALANAYGSVEEEVEDLYYRSLDEYDDFQLDEAKNLLDQAMSVAAQSGLKNTLTAQIHLQLGVILFAEGDSDGARGEFADALNDDPYIELDPLMSSPSLQKTFDEMKAQAATSGGGAGGPGGGSGYGSAEGGYGEYGGGGTMAGSDSGSGDGYGAPVSAAPAAGAGLSHQPVLQAVHGVGIALYMEVPRGLPVARVFAVYRNQNAQEWNSIEMEPRGRSGFAAAIPGHDVSGEVIFYHLEVMDAGGNIVASAGTANNPYRIRLSPAAPPSPPPPPAYPSAGSSGSGGYQGQPSSGSQYGGGYGYGGQSSGTGAGSTGSSAYGDSSSSYWQQPSSQGGYGSQGMGGGGGGAFSFSGSSGVGAYSSPDRTVSLSLEGGFGFGVAKGPTLRTSQYVEVGPGLAWSSIAQLKVDAGYFIKNNLQAGLGMRLQFIGDEDAGIVMEPMVTVKGRYYYGLAPVYRLYVGGGAGLGSVQHTVNLGDQYGGYLDTTRAGGTEPLFAGLSGYHVMAITGMEYSISDELSLVGGIDLYLLLPSVSVHADVSAGMAFSF